VVRGGLVLRRSPEQAREQRTTHVLVPAFEHAKRLATCQACEQFGSNRCPLIDLGCRNTFKETIWSTRGACPQGKWPDGREPWITTAQLAAGAIELADQIPPDVTRIVGIPRSGMIPAAAIASKLHLPLFTIHNWRVVPAGGGFRTGWGKLKSTGGRSCFVDDTLHNGGSFQRLHNAGLLTNGHLKAVVFTLDASRVDLYHSRLASPHLLEWNLFNTAYIKHLATDLDGIICHNPPSQERPKFLPRLESVRLIVSARPEAERPQTEAWLAHYGVRYQSLRLWQGTEADRWDVERVAAWKAQECSQAGVEFYIESEPPLADAIRRHGLRVLCPVQGYLA
jgi:hypothetical protein